MATHVAHPVRTRIIDWVAWLWLKHQRSVLGALSTVLGLGIAAVVILVSLWLHHMRLYAGEMGVLLGSFLVLASVLAWVWGGRP